jgi:hypothetical protein
MTIDDYLDQLERELRRRRAPAPRLLREAEDHLHDLAGEHVAAGLEPERAEAQAVEQFGAAATVAARFAEATASTEAHRAVGLSLVAFAAYAGVFVAFGTVASPLLRDFPQGAASFFALQVAAVALIVAAVRSLRWRGAAAMPTSELRAIAHALSGASVALVGAALAEGAVALTRPAGVIAWSNGRWLTLAFAAALGVLLLSAVAAVRSGAQAQATAALPSRRTHRSAVELLGEDVDALMERARMPGASRRAVRALLAHPWRATLAVAAAAFLAVSATGFAESGSSGLSGAAVLGAVEASLVIVSFLAFGHLLGLRERQPQCTG